MKKLFLLLLAPFVLVACANDSIEQELGGVVTASALVVALPLIPFAEVYHTFNQTDKKLAAEREHWESVFDPVYAKRIEIIESRNPSRDAQTVLRESTPFYLPSMISRTPDPNLGALYPGVEDIWSSDPDPRYNHEAAMKSEMGRYLWDLLSNDPAHDSAEGVLYFSDRFKAFIQIRFAYMETFNRTIYQTSNE